MTTQFFQTGMGRAFFQSHIPRAVKALERVTDLLSSSNRGLQGRKATLLSRDSDEEGDEVIVLEVHCNHIPPVRPGAGDFVEWVAIVQHSDGSLQSVRDIDLLLRVTVD